MPTLPKPFVETEGAAKAWTRSTGIVANRAYLGAPDEPHYPLIIVFRVGGGPVTGDVPIDNAMLQWDVWGDEEKKGKDRYDLAAIATRLCTAIESLASGTVMVPGVVALGGKVESAPLWRPNPENLQGRYVITASIAMRSAS